MSLFLHGLAKNRASNIGREPEKFVVEILFLWKKKNKSFGLFSGSIENYLYLKYPGTKGQLEIEI